jgi:hypothetical protein
MVPAIAIDDIKHDTEEHGHRYRTFTVTRGAGNKAAIKKCGSLRLTLKVDSGPAVHKTP